MKEEFLAWAIDTRSNEGHGFIGRYWHFGGEYPRISVGLQGCEVALFSTRAMARKYLPDVTRFSFPDARVVRIKVTVAPLP